MYGWRAKHAENPDVTGAADKPRILIIKLGALGDFIQSLGPMQAIARHHKNASLTLLTTAPLVEIARQSRLFDEIWGDGRPRGFMKTLSLVRRLSWAGFQRVYDLQTQSRSNLYFYLLWPKTEWSGIAYGASHRHADPLRERMHVTDVQRAQLKCAGIDDVRAADLSFLTGDIGNIKVKPPYILLVPGGAAHRLAKRWPASCYGEIAREISRQGMTPVIIGGNEERDIAREIKTRAPASVDLSGQTNFGELATLARGAKAALGNDTGPMHIIARVGCPSLVLFSQASDPALCAPQGPKVDILQGRDLSAVAPSEVLERLQSLS